MLDNNCRVLLVENDPLTIQLIKKLLLVSESDRLSSECHRFDIEDVDTLEEALNALSSSTFDIILINLFFLINTDLNPIKKIKENSSNIPILIHTLKEDENFIIKAFQEGAEGHIQLSNIDNRLLRYQIKTTIDRFNYIEKLKQQQQEKEFQELEDLVRREKTGITARMFGSEGLRQSAPDIFNELVRTYGEFLELALEQQNYKVEHNISEKLRLLGDKLGFLKAGPRDIIELHTTTLREKSRGVTAMKARAYRDEGRLMVLELMGYLVSFYRKYYIGLSNMSLFNKYE